MLKCEKLCANVCQRPKADVCDHGFDGPSACHAGFLEMVLEAVLESVGRCQVVGEQLASEQLSATASKASLQIAYKMDWIS
jgi:hypothetical protein